MSNLTQSLIAGTFITHEMPGVVFPVTDLAICCPIPGIPLFNECFNGYAGLKAYPAILLFFPATAKRALIRWECAEKVDGDEKHSKISLCFRLAVKPLTDFKRGPYLGPLLIMRLEK